MRYIFAYMVLIVISSCSINDLEPNQKETFLKFYSETNQMESKDLLVLNDGYLILSTYRDTTTLLLKTDLLGNKLWAQSFNYFQGNSMATLTDGYILIGDSINNQTDPISTKMQLIKTDFDGNFSISTELGSGFYHGTAVIQASTGAVIGLGYSSPPAMDGYIVAMGFNADLTDNWVSERNYMVANENRLSSKSMYEADNGNLTWLSYSESSNIISKLNFSNVPPDNDSDDNGSPLFNGEEFSNTNGDIVKNSTGYAVVQTVKDGGKNKINITDGFNEVLLNENEFANDNYTGTSITNATNGLLIAASTDRHETGSARTDEDLLLLELNYNGTVKSNGINITYGGIGDEIPVRIKRANDGGFVVLGTSINSKGAQQTFLLKTNNKGALN
jgi:hypothetical protein